MKVFVSSVISAFESYRAATASAVESLGYEVIRAEDFGATATSPQEACLAGVREADLTIVMLGGRYGATQPSGLSATHEEYREAQGRHPVLAFVQEGVDYDPLQTEFIREVREWETGSLTGSFTSVVQLQSAVTRGLHELMVSAASGSVDERELLGRAEESAEAPQDYRSQPQLVLCVASAPHQEVLRPTKLEDATFARELEQAALFGPHALFVVKGGAESELRSDWLVVSQEGASVQINSAGDVVVHQPVVAADRGPLEFPALIQEEIRERLAMALNFAASVLDSIDSVRRLSHVAVVAALTGVSYQAWRTREEHAQSPQAGSFGGGFGLSQDRVAVHLNPAVRSRAELGQRVDDWADDLMVLLRRDLRQ